MILEMKVPSPGESITEVEIARWLVKTGDYVEKNQTIAEVDSDKATLELPAEASGVITLQAEEGDAVAVGQVVCLIDTSAEKTTTAAPTKEQPKVETPKPDVVKTAPAQAEPQPTYASNTPSPAAKKILAEKNISNQEVKGTGKSRTHHESRCINSIKTCYGNALRWKSCRNTHQNVYASPKSSRTFS
ncbi:2-oxoglutarate dehydrogenase complex component E2 (fragment) [Capnocytophaga canimorsus]